MFVLNVVIDVDAEAWGLHHAQESPPPMGWLGRNLGKYLLTVRDETRTEGYRRIYTE